MNRKTAIGAGVALALLVPATGFAVASANNAAAQPLQLTSATPEPAQWQLAEVPTIAERKAAKERAAERAFRKQQAKFTPAYAKSYAKRYMQKHYGWGAGEHSALVQLWNHESEWNHMNENPSSGAYGIPQSLPGDKMASEGKDWRTNPETQIQWGLKYIKDTYGSPSGAWGFFQSNNWY